MELLRSRLERVRQQMARACERSSRPADSVRLLAVTKTRPVSDIQALNQLGLTAFGENRVAEALEKQSQIPGCEWHMIGHLQSNKAKDCLGFDWVHSLDRAETGAALEKNFAKAGRKLNVLLEVNTGGEAAKEGVRGWDELRRLADSIVALPHLTIRGLMTMAPFSPHETMVRPCFVQLREFRDALSADYPSCDWGTLSMGMTNDFTWAIEEGSTLVRIGTALFEDRR